MAAEVSASSDFVKQMAGYGLTTAHILYRMPDHPGLLQTYLWQHYDVFPDFPVLHRFLDFWKREIEGPLHTITVSHARLIKPAEIRAVDGIFRLN
ncbi:usg protein [Ancylobacter terrae]|uniref:usg protein n=1 Tax=Ancylobacter sp. sgz301288 TaxID=3342077 RepID=UPI00385865BB